MRTPANVAGHPIHPMLIVFPVGLLIFSLICDLIALFSADPQTWHTVALYAMVGGFVGALIAAIPGFIDFLSITDDRVRKIAIMHMACNLIAVTLYAVNIWLRVNGDEVNGTPLVLSIIAVCLLGISGWLGGAMVYRNGVGVNVGSNH
ncbi:MAG TPA: DUF2231 domain-containing protein [Methylophilaceae bacterium]|nr:DUF2231 domain-containing protein [Methylophilaceae bacterium]